MDKLVIKLAKFFLQTHIGFPYFSPDYVRRYIERPETEAADLQEYKWTAQRSRPWRIVFVSLAFVLSCCAFAVAAMLMFELDFKDPERNLVPLVASPNLNDNSTTPKHRFNCLATDCTTRFKVSHDESGSLASDLLELPLFSMCHPTLSFFYENTQLFNPLGLLFIGTLMSVKFTAGVVFPLLQVSIKAPNLLLMFLVAPEVTRRVVYDRVRELYDEMKRSRLNCELNYQLRIRKAHHQQQAATGESLNRLPARPKCGLYPARSPFPALTEHSPIDSSENENCVHKFSHDCIPIMRSSWWHRKASRAFYLLFVASFINLICLTLTHYIIMLVQATRSQAKLTIVGQRANLNNCTIWIEDTSSVLYDGLNPPGYRKLNLATYELQTHPLGMLLYIVRYCFIITCCDFLLIIYLLVAAELSGWLYEIKLQLRLANEYLRQLSECNERRSYNSVKHGIVQSFELEQLRHLYASITRLRFFVLVEHRRFGRLEGSRMRTTDSRFESTVAIERFVAQSVEQQQLQLSAALELLEKLHVNFRLFIEHVHHYGPTMTIIICLSTLHTYILVAISIGYIRRVNEHDPAPIMLVLLSWIFTNSLLGFMSSFHAQAKEVQTLIWSLLAVLTPRVALDARSRHLHCLWFKQLIAMDHGHGLALKAFNLSITHLKMIQLVLGSATLMSFALR